MKEKKEQWNHRIKAELADAMRSLQENRNKMHGNEQSLRDLTEEAIMLFLNFNGVKVKDPQ
jgi:ABC-type transporter MlaC component